MEEVFEAKKRLNVKEITNDVTTTSQLRDLHLKFHNLSFENLCKVDVRRCEGLKYVFPAFVARSLRQLEKLRVMDCKGVETIVDVDVDDENKEVVEEEVSTTFIFPKLTTLCLSELPKVECFYPKKHTLEWPVLKNLGVDDCDKISSLDLLNFSENQEHNQFEMLEMVTIKSKNMKMVIRHLELFLNLKRLTVTGFDGDESAAAAFPSNFLYALHNLETLTIEKSSFGEIFGYEEGQEEILSPSLLPNLTDLTLDNMGELKYICTQNSPFFPILNQLHYLTVKECPRLTNLVPTPLLSFKFLFILTVRNCGGLIYLIPSSTAASLEQLRMLTIRGCSMIEEIVAADDSQQDHHHFIIFSKLEYLVLEELPRLTSFCTANNYTFNFPKLDYVQVSKCPNMRTFSPGITITPKLKKVSFEEDAKLWKGDLNTTIQHHFSQMETPRLTAADPTTSEPVAQIHDAPTESAANEIEEIGEESTKQREEGQTSEPREEIRTCVDATKPSEKGKEKIQDQASSSSTSTMPFYGGSSVSTEQQSEKSQETVPEDIVASSSLLSPPSNRPQTSPSLVTEAGTSKAGSNSQHTLLSEEQETKRLATIDPSTSSNNLSEPETKIEEISENLTDPGDGIEVLVKCNEPRKGTEICEEVADPAGNEGETWNHPRLESNIEASTSQKKDFQRSSVTKDFIPLLNEVTQILQTQPLNSMSAQQVQFMEEAFRDLSNMNFSIEWFCPFIEKARECVSVVEREREISELELKIAETKAQLQELEENKKALEEKNKAIASSVNLDKSVYDN